MFRGNRRVDFSDAGGRTTSLPAYQLSSAQVLAELKTDSTHGLHSHSIAGLRQSYGSNSFANGSSVSVLSILVGQISNPMVLILSIAMSASFAIQDYPSGAAILVVIFINVSIGFYMYYSAERTMDSLRSLASPTARVIRDGRSQVIPSMEVVPGDIVELVTGDSVPADLRLIESMNFETDEALLTGECLPVAKDEAVVFDSTVSISPGDRINVAYMSTIVTKGRALGVAYATGMSTGIGQIAKSIRHTPKQAVPQRVKADGSVVPLTGIERIMHSISHTVMAFFGLNVGTPLQRKLSLLALFLLFFALLCALIVFAANSFRVDQDVTAYAVVTGISMIPASLIVVLTITMSVGAKIMVQRHVIVRRLDALEALGGVTNICSDKTGTLTQGRMFARSMWLPSLGLIQIMPTSEPFNPTQGAMHLYKGSPSESVYSSDEKSEVLPIELLGCSASLNDFVRVAALANVASVSFSAGDETWDVSGEPTEIALQVLASRFNHNRRNLTKGDQPDWTELAEYPFSSDVKRMSVIFRSNSNDEIYTFTKGAVERVLDACKDAVWANEKKIPIEESTKSIILERVEALASEGLRVLAFAYKNMTGSVVKDYKAIPRQEVEAGLTFIGLVGIYDPPRAESRDAVRKCHSAGISVHMLTGDHAATAAAIAKEIRILPPDMSALSQEMVQAMVMTAVQFDALTDAQIDSLPVLPLIIARCTPQTKVRMIEALHRRHAHVAMTGDGVNDSPSLKRADVGIAMGQSGSDVAKDASELVLTDDNFASILNAIEEGRRMFDNIKKFVTHLLAQNVAQAGTLLIGLAFKDPNGRSVFPLSSLGILFVVMVTSTFPAMGLGFETAQTGILQRPPHDLRMGVFTWELLCDTFVYGLLIAALCLSSFILRVYALSGGEVIGLDCNERNLTKGCLAVFEGRASTFVCLVWFSSLLAWQLMDTRRSLFRMKAKPANAFTQFFKDIWQNRFLFWSVTGCMLSVFLIVHIPWVNRYLFIITDMAGADWAIVLSFTVVFLATCDAYKWCKRIFFRRQQNTMRRDEENLPFERFSTQLETCATDTLDKK